MNHLTNTKSNIPVGLILNTLTNIADSEVISHMWELLLDKKYETKDFILKIQNTCKFYNHEIFHFPAVEEKVENKSELSNTYNIYGDVGNINTGDVNIKGNQIGLQDSK